MTEFLSGGAHRPVAPFQRFSLQGIPILRVSEQPNLHWMAGAPHSEPQRRGALYCPCRDPSWCVSPQDFKKYVYLFPATFQLDEGWENSWAWSSWSRTLIAQLSLRFLDCCMHKQETKLPQAVRIASFTSRWTLFSKVPDATVEVMSMSLSVKRWITDNVPYLCL